MEEKKEVVVDESAIRMPDDIFEEAVATPDVAVEAPKVESKPTPTRPQGFKTYDEWTAEGRDPAEFKGEKAYIKEGEVYKALIDTQKKAKAQDEAIQKLFEHNKKVEELAYRRAIDDIKREQSEAASYGDSTRVAALTDKLVELSATQNVTAPVEHERVPVNPPVQQQPMTEAGEVAMKFVAENHWYMRPVTNDDFAKKAFTDIEDIKISKEFKDLTPSQHMDILNSRIKERFEGKTNLSSKVIGGSTGAVGEESSSFREILNKLPAFDREMIKAMKQKDKNFSLADLKRYARQVTDLGENN